MIPAHQLGWMAGVVDLKGRILFKRNKTRATRQITLAVESKEIGIVKALGRMTGTNPEMHDASPLADWMRRGCLEHCPEQHIHAYRDGLMVPAIARWTVSGAAMVTVLENLAPFLLLDRDYDMATDETRAGLDFTGRGSTSVVRSLRRLENLGWDLPEDFAQALQDLQQQPSTEAAAA